MPASPPRNPGWWSSFLRYFIPLALVTTGILALFAWFDNRHQMELLKSREMTETTIVQQRMGRELEQAKADLQTLAQMPAILEWVEAPSPRTEARMVRACSAFSRWHKAYDHIRFLDAKGMERIRINLLGDETVALAKEKLKYKGDRDFFLDSINLEPGGVYISPLTLNMQRDPGEAIKPTVRIGTPVTEARGNKVGVLVINLIADGMLAWLEQGSQGDPSASELLNAQGYWLHAADPTKEFAFLYGKEQSFARSYPWEWSRILARETWQFRSAVGLVTARTIRMPVQGTPSEPNFWKLVSIISNQELTQFSWVHRRESWLVAAGLLGLMTLVSAGLATAIQRSRLAEEAMVLSRFTADHVADALLLIGPEGRIVDTNPTAQEILGYSRDEFLGMEIFDLDPLLTPAQWAELCRNLEQHRSLVHEAQKRTRDGRLLPVEVHSSLFRAGDQVFVCDFIRDITERKQAEEALRNSEENLAITLQSIGDGVIATDAQGRVTRMNATAERLTGWPLAAAATRPLGEVFRIVNALTREPSQDPVEKVLAHGDIVGLANHTALLSRDGEEYQIADSAAPIRDASGTMVGVVLVFSDVTQEYRVQAALAEREERYRTFFTHGPDGIVVLDPETTRPLEFNDQACRQLGYTREEFSRLTIADIEAAETGLETSRHIQKVQREGYDDFETQQRTKQGELRNVHVTAQFIQTPGSSTYHCVWRDITERRRAEASLQESNQRLQLATASSGLGVWDWDIRSGTMAWDDRVVELYGATRGEIHGTVQDWKEGLHPEDLERAVAECGAALNGEAPFDTEFRAQHRDGTVLWIKANAIVLKDNEGNPVRMIGLNQDVTSIHLAEEEKARLQAQLQQSQKMESLGTLAGGVAHDMNNVLGAILGMATANIATQPVDSPTYRAFDTIIQAATRGGKMVKSLLGFARQSPAEALELDMNEILREEIRLLERTTLAKIRLEMDLAIPLRPVRGDASALTHAFMNLCVNAVDAMPENGTLTLRTRNVDNDWVEVMVEDTGIGMPKEILDKALDPFFTTKEQGKGTGLGLSMVYSTVMAHQGQMELQSEPGHGTRVRMRFPACASVTSIPGPTADPRSATAQVALKVLLVDDDELIQSSTQAILEVLGHSVTSVFRGEEALVQLEAGLKPDVVILDMNMPGLGGSGTLPRLRALNPTVPVLLATGRVDQAALNLAGAHPHITLLSKPFAMKELKQHLEAVAPS